MIGFDFSLCALVLDLASGNNFYLSFLFYVTPASLNSFDWDSSCTFFFFQLQNSFILGLLVLFGEDKYIEYLSIYYIYCWKTLSSARRHVEKKL